MPLLKFIVLTLLFICAVSCSKAPENKHNNHYHMTDEEMRLIQKYGINAGCYLTPKKIRELAAKAEKGDNEAAYKISQHYRYIENDENKFLYWVEKAAENGHVKAQYEIAKIYSDKLHDREQSIYWLKKAAEGGYVDAQYELAGNLYTSDSTQAHYWLKKAAENGDSRAKKILEQEKVKSGKK